MVVASQKNLFDSIYLCSCSRIGFVYIINDRYIRIVGLIGLGRFFCVNTYAYTNAIRHARDKCVESCDVDYFMHVLI